MSDELISIPYLGKKIEACITTPSDPYQNDFGVVLTHGAGGDMHLSQLKLLANYLADKGILVVRFTCKGLNLAYRVKVYTHVLKYICAKYSDVQKFFLAGRSMGARAAVVTANNTKGTQLEAKIAGVVALSYPLHTKDDRDSLRDGPLYDLTKPICFISGTLDEMCNQKTFETVLNTVSRHEIKWIWGGNHGLKVKGSKEEDIVDEVGQTLAKWCRQIITTQSGIEGTHSEGENSKCASGSTQSETKKDLKRKTKDHTGLNEQDRNSTCASRSAKNVARKTQKRKLNENASDEISRPIRKKSRTRR